MHQCYCGDECDCGAVDEASCRGCAECNLGDDEDLDEEYDEED